ncbi:hypothetical protein BsWGS_10173 [Bradybaena similaris]
MSCLLMVTVLCCAFIYGLAHKVPLVDCGSKLATVHGVDVDPCPKLPCEFKKNTSVILTITFTPNRTIDNATVEFAGSLFWNLFIPYTLQDSNACHRIQCPIKFGVPVTYTTKLPVYDKMPEVSVTVKGMLKMKSTEIVCLILPVVIIG